MRAGISPPLFSLPTYCILTRYFSEQSIIDTFAKVWGTNELLVSFDGMNLTLPSSDLKPSTPWPHVDQNPNRKGMQCVQGILNLAPNGPDDGGLVVLKGSHRQNEAFFKTHPETEGAGTWGSADWHGFNEEEVGWFKSRGCEEVKVCAGPGGEFYLNAGVKKEGKLTGAQI